MYKMFIDDERFPPNDGAIDWEICRSAYEVKSMIARYGFPYHVSFDHDLGQDTPTGHDIAKMIVELDLDNNCIPEGFTFYVHSQNPVGAANITGLLGGYLAIKNGT